MATSAGGDNDGQTKSPDILSDEGNQVKANSILKDRNRPKSATVQRQMSEPTTSQHHRKGNKTRPQSAQIIRQKSEGSNLKEQISKPKKSTANHNQTESTTVPGHLEGVKPQHHLEETSTYSCGKAWMVDTTDFEAVKHKKKSARPPSAASNKSSASKCSYVPPKNVATVELIQQRKVLDLQRWYCISRPQYKASCGISSLVSCWNYLFSTLGKGSLNPITQEEALVILGFKPPFAEIKFGPFTGNKTLERWFLLLNQHFKVRGSSSVIYKPKGKNQTKISSEDALKKLKKGLQGDATTYIYHCNNHYFCPIGFEDVPINPEDAYKTGLSLNEVETWILIGEPSRMQPCMHCKRWSDIDKDLNCESPDFLDIRRLWKDMQKRNTKRVGGNLHCIMAFNRSPYQGVKTSPTISKKDNEITIENSVQDTAEDTLIIHPEEADHDFSHIVSDDSVDDETMIEDLNEDENIKLEEKYITPEIKAMKYTDMLEQNENKRKTVIKKLGQGDAKDNSEKSKRTQVISGETNPLSSDKSEIVSGAKTKADLTVEHKEMLEKSAQILNSILKDEENRSSSHGLNISKDDIMEDKPFLLKDIAIGRESGNLDSLAQRVHKLEAVFIGSESQGTTSNQISSIANEELESGNVRALNTETQLRKAGSNQNTVDDIGLKINKGKSSTFAVPPLDRNSSRGLNLVNSGELLNSVKNNDFNSNEFSLNPLAMKVQKLDFASILSDTDKAELDISQKLTGDYSSLENIQNSSYLRHQNSTYKIENLTDSRNRNFTYELESDNHNQFAMKVQKFDFESLLGDIDKNSQGDLLLSKVLFTRSNKLIYDDIGSTGTCHSYRSGNKLHNTDPYMYAHTAKEGGHRLVKSMSHDSVQVSTRHGKSMVNKKGVYKQKTGSRDMMAQGLSPRGEFGSTKDELSTYKWSHKK